MRIRNAARELKDDGVEQHEAALLNKLPPNCAVSSTGTRRTASAMPANVLFGLWVSRTTSAPSSGRFARSSH